MAEKTLTRAMRRWVEQLDKGYKIGPRLRMGPHGYLEWGPALFNPDGAYVQNVRRDTVERLWALGILSKEVKDGYLTRAGTPASGDQ